MIGDEDNEQPSRVTPTGDTRVFDENEKSIARLEEWIADIKSSPKAKTKANQALIKSLQSRLNKIYSEQKQEIMNLERENYNYLLFLRSTHGFWKLFGHSLYFYAFDIAPKLNMEARIYSDGDYEAKSEAGVISVKDLSTVTKRLKELKITRLARKKSNGNIVIYKIPWKYSEKELDKFADQNNYNVRKYNHVVMVENTMPVLYLNLNNLLKACYENVRRLDPTARETMGNLVVELVAEMIRIYIEMSNGRVGEKQAITLLYARLNKIKCQVKILVDLKLWNVRTYARIGEIIIKVQDIIDIKRREQSE